MGMRKKGGQETRGKRRRKFDLAEGMNKNGKGWKWRKKEKRWKDEEEKARNKGKKGEKVK